MKCYFKELVDTIINKLMYQEWEVRISSGGGYKVIA